jgi:hypothetical protein
MGRRIGRMFRGNWGESRVCARHWEVLVVARGTALVNIAKNCGGTVVEASCEKCSRRWVFVVGIGGAP